MSTNPVTGDAVSTREDPAVDNLPAFWLSRTGVVHLTAAGCRRASTTRRGGRATGKLLDRAPANAGRCRKCFPATSG